MWRDAGLVIDDDGFVLRRNATDMGEVVMEVDMICNAMIWIMSKLVNFVAAGEGFHPVPAGYRPFNAQEDEPLKIGVSQQRLLERWANIKKLLKTWFDGLPSIFKPCARIEPSLQSDEDPYNHIFSRIWYSMPMCSSCMQQYHTAQIVLLINRPHESTLRRSNIAERLKSYRSIDAEIMYHCREIWYD